MLELIKQKVVDLFKTQTSTSESGKVNSVDVKKTGVTLLLGAAGAVIAYLATAIPSLDLGAYTVFVVPPILAALELGRRWIKDNTPAEKAE